MNVFLDTNVVMDYLCSRGNTEKVNLIFKMIETKEITPFISIGSYYTITYLTDIFLKSKGHKSPERLEILRNILESLLACINISGHTKAELIAGTMDEKFKDLEDSYQYQAAISSNCNVIITSNIKDFKGVENDIEIVEPDKFVIGDRFL